MNILRKKMHHWEMLVHKICHNRTSRPLLKRFLTVVRTDCKENYSAYVWIFFFSNTCFSTSKNVFGIKSLAYDNSSHIIILFLLSSSFLTRWSQLFILVISFLFCIFLKHCLLWYLIVVFFVIRFLVSSYAFICINV